MPDMHVRASLMDKVKPRHTVCNPNEDKRVAAPTTEILNTCLLLLINRLLKFPTDIYKDIHIV